MMDIVERLRASLTDGHEYSSNHDLRKNCLTEITSLRSELESRKLQLESLQAKYNRAMRELVKASNGVEIGPRVITSNAQRAESENT